MTIQFGTKSETLARLTGRVATARILPQVTITLGEWRADRDSVLARILREAWTEGRLIARSSASGEDGRGASLAGHYRSVGGIAGRTALAQAIDAVAASYGDAAADSEQVFIQPMLERVAASGVVFSRDPNTGAPYIVVNYHEGSDTSAVTGGTSADTQAFMLSRHAGEPQHGMIGAVVALVEELERLLGPDPLDIEFAWDTEGLVLLQVRPLAVPPPLSGDAATHRRLLDGIARKVALGLRPHPYLYGDRTVYGVMPDWNPAEIIGIRPRPLALSLYRSLVTDSIWAYQRHNYGYRNLRSFPLLLSFGGLPYIDVRVSFNSFLPQSLEPDLARRLVDYYIQRLVTAPALHDKVEFEIVFSCYTLDLPERLAELERHGFTAADRDCLAEHLRQLTNRIIAGDKPLWRTDYGKIGILEERRRAIMAADLDRVSRIYWLLEDCKRYGTLPFAGLARAAFIAVQMLRSLVAVGILGEAQRDAFVHDLDSVSRRMTQDLGTLSRTVFLAKYGHLRPGTYDILSPRYDETPDAYFDWAATGDAAPAADRHFGLSLDQLRRTEALLRQHRLDLDVVGLFDFIQSAMQWREEAKFVFTHSLSDALSLMGALGEEHGLTPEDVSFADISCIEELYASADDVGDCLRRGIERGKADYAKACSLILPPLITRPDDVFAFRLPSTEPNFITQERAEGWVVGADDPTRDMHGAIVAIAGADPGYDWIFSRGIAGFVTAYGGANSHMAIRAGELGLPAVIGAGEVAFAKWRSARRLLLDCAARKVEIRA